MLNRLLLVALAVLCVLVSSRSLPSIIRALTIEDRIEAQRAIEEVYWSHRIWPAENRSPKPPFSAVMSDAALRSRVEDYLRKSNALAAVWGRPITSEQLQAEMERMARDTEAPEVLSALFAALGNDPVLIAETLVRQKLVERRLRDAYAYDEQFHGSAKRSAEGALSRVRRVADLKTLGGEYRETTWRLSDRVESRVRREDLGDGGRTTVKLDREKWDRHLRELAGKIHAPAGSAGWSRLEETADSFTVTAILSEESAAVTTATVSWPKVSFDVWWSKERNTLGTSLAEGVGTFAAVQPRGTACVDDTWRKTFDANIPDGRGFHSAVWTGTEMIVWGGLAGGWMPENTGGRYDPSTDTWAPTSTDAGVPQGRGGHTAVWTGTKMIVWGGSEPPNNAGVNTGGLYDPSTDTWEPTSTGAGVPQGRDNHTAVWTGSRMIVWGGADQHQLPLNTGGRYDPSTNTWASTSTGAGVPSARSNHTAVWTGTEMIVWGGHQRSFTYLNSGGRYDPTTDTWAATSTGAGVPASRAWHTAVWTGTKMIIWGGSSSGAYLNTGGRYDPSTNTWEETSTAAGVPSARSNHTAVWTGTEMIVWGGSNGAPLNKGGRYDPLTNTWASTSTGAGVPSSRYFHTAVWTGTEMIVWGGNYSSFTDLNSGGRYDPATDMWAITSTAAGVPTGRAYITAVWTGAEMIVWGGFDGLDLNTGGRYEPATDTWGATSTGSGLPSGRSGHTAVWTGTEMIVWGGYHRNPTQYLSTGGRYNPALDTWTTTSTGAGVPSERAFHTAVWTGTEMIVWGGDRFEAYRKSGGRYDPALDTWTATSTGAGVPSERASHTAVWTGTEMIVWGGYGFSDHVNSGGRFDPATNTWAETSTGAGDPSPRSDHTAVWTGAEMIVWGGQDISDNLNSGGRYDPSTDTWGETSTAAGVPSGRSLAAAVWTGTEMIVWGGFDEVPVNTGGRYDPSTNTWAATSTGAFVPSPRYAHAAVWTGTEMIVWGGDPANSRGGRYCASVSCVDLPTMCDDGDACTSDACDAGTGQCVNTPIACNDGNVCNGVETCDPASGCVAGTAIICADGNACNGDESCDPTTGCIAGTPLVCNDGNACNGVESCNPASGCVAGSPVVCAAADPCHQAGVCQPGSGACTYANQPDGATCDDGNTQTSDDRCQAGVCAGTNCGVQPRPKSSGYYKKLCKDGHGRSYHGDELTTADATCVGQLTATFAGVSTVEDLCAVLDHDGHGPQPDGDASSGKECQKAEAELMALVLNICRDYVCESQEVDSGCSGHDSHLNHTLTTVGASLASTDAILSDPARDGTTCKDARCLAKEINNGKGLHHISLTTMRDQGNNVRLNWENPVMDDGSGGASSYTIWRRPLQANAAFVELGHANNTTFVDNAAGTGNFEYEVTFTIEP